MLKRNSGVCPTFFTCVYFFLCLSRKTLDRFFILLHHCFYFYNSQICTEQTGLTIRFVIPWKHLCSCIKNFRNKRGADLFFLFLHVATHSLVERLCYLIIKTKTLGTKKCFHGMKKEITSQKKLFKVKKNNVTVKGKRPVLLFYFTDFEMVFVSWVISFIFSFLD